jgi:hypothetical protein
LKPIVSTRSRTRRKSDRLAIAADNHDINQMKFSTIVMAVAMSTLMAGTVFGQQMVPPGWSQFNPPLPAPPPPPRIEAPVVPEMDAPSQPRVRSERRRSFDERITQCLQDGAASGLGPNARAAYSRACANRD